MTVSTKAARACDQWLKTCKDLGWRKEDMPGLCDLWWKYHDDDGVLYPPGQSRSPQRGDHADQA